MSVVLCVGRDLLIPLLYIGVMAILPSTHGEYLVTMMQISAGGSKLLLETRRWMDGRESKPRLERSKKKRFTGAVLGFPSWPNLGTSHLAFEFSSITV